MSEMTFFVAHSERFYLTLTITSKFSTHTILIGKYLLINKVKMIVTVNFVIAVHSFVWQPQKTHFQP